MLTQTALDIDQTIRELEQALNLSITVHDLCGILSSSEGKYLLANRHLHPSPLCQRHEDIPTTNNLCVQHCQKHISRKANELMVPFCDTCYREITEIIVPIIRQERIVLLMYAGSFRKPGTRPPRELLPEKLLPVWQKLPIFSESEAAKATRLLTLLGQGILFAAEAENAPPPTDDRRAMIELFIYENAHKNITINELAQRLHLSVSRTGHLIPEIFNCNFKDLLNLERLRRAKSLLTSSNASAASIASRCGFTNPYYFSRLFKKTTGQSPLSYRRNNKNWLK